MIFEEQTRIIFACSTRGKTAGPTGPPWAADKLYALGIPKMEIWL